jgi:hypothetical protein
MQLFLKLFGPYLQWVYHGFDRIVINGHLLGLMRESQVVYFFRDVCGHPKPPSTCCSRAAGAPARRMALGLSGLQARLQARRHRVPPWWQVPDAYSHLLAAVGKQKSIFWPA